MSSLFFFSFLVSYSLIWGPPIFHFQNISLWNFWRGNFVSYLILPLISNISSPFYLFTYFLSVCVVVVWWISRSRWNFDINMKRNKIIIFHRKSRQLTLTDCRKKKKKLGFLFFFWRMWNSLGVFRVIATEEKKINWNLIFFFFFFPVLLAVLNWKPRKKREADYTIGIFQSIGLKEFHEYLVLPSSEKTSQIGQRLLDQGVEALKIRTRRYARKQIKWIVKRFLEQPDRQVFQHHQFISNWWCSANNFLFAFF